MITLEIAKIDIEKGKTSLMKAFCRVQHKRTGVGRRLISSTTV
jgi:hypothetical protein